MTFCFSQASARLRPLILEQLSRVAGMAQPRRIVLKPNWVLHETDPAFPIRALVTDARVIDATIAACLQLFPHSESITIGDCPLQTCDWELMLRQSGLDEVRNHYRKVAPDKVRFLDLRREVVVKNDAGFMVPSTAEHGDPQGYCEVSLGARSHLEPISNQADRFAVNDYSSSVTSSNHRQGDHRYLVSRTILDSDLLINLPKWKSHQKSGITCALKNLVGINGDKAYLPHFRKGAPKWGGDEYKDDQRWMYWLQTTLREKLQKRSQFAFRMLKPGWELIKRLRGIETKMRDRGDSQAKQYYVAGGAWHGNQTIWRMIYDLNLIIQCADRQGTIHPTPQRQYFCIVDGLISGEGNGPLQPLPREIDWIAMGQDPFEIDTALAWFMGFVPDQIPLLAQRDQFLGPAWGDNPISQQRVNLDGTISRLLDSPINFQFLPPPGWRNHIERRLAV